MHLLIQIPCYNEERNIAQTLADLPTQVAGISRITKLIIDDGSRDSTAAVAIASGADYVIQHPYNQGLAKAFMTGIQTSLALGADIIVNTDADNQYPGRYIADLVKPILTGEAAIVIGDRQVHRVEHFSTLKRVLEQLGSWFMRQVSGTDVKDAPSGFRAYSRYSALHLRVFNRYSYTLETLIQAGREKVPIAQIPITTNPPTRESRLHRGILSFIWRQTGTIIRSYVLYQPLKTFLLLSLPFIFASAVLTTRFFYFYVSHQAGVGRYIQSVSLGGALGIFGIVLLVVGLLGDATRTNRQMIDELITALRADLTINQTDTKFNGYSLLRRPCGEPK